MFRSFALGTVAAVFATSAMAVAAPQDDVKAAAQKLADANSYSWKTTVESAGGNNNRGGGPVEGQTEKDGYTFVTLTRGDNKTEVLKKGDKVAIKTDDGWKSPDELSQDNGNGQPNRGGFMARMVQRLQPPAKQAEELAGQVKELSQSGEAWSGDLSEDGVKQALMFGRGRRNNNNAGNDNGNGPQISNPKGTVKFWVKDGVLTKYEVHVSATMSFNGNDRDIDRTTTTEISDVGSTKVNAPDEAKKKIEG